MIDLGEHLPDAGAFQVAEVGAVDRQTDHQQQPAEQCPEQIANADHGAPSSIYR
ncbi:hypothetical protein D3C81_2239440 [compost metagenome]